MSDIEYQISTSVYGVIEELKRSNTYFYLISTIPYAITICVAFPGQRIEIDVYEDGQIDIAQFAGEEIADMTLNDFLALVAKENAEAI